MWEWSAFNCLNSLNKRNNLYGVDKSRNLIKFYDEEFKINVKFSFGNCSRLPYSNNSIDMIICYGVLPYIKKPKKVFDEINRVLKSHGEVLIWTPPKPKQKVYSYSNLLNTYQNMLG